ncbi:hypothetical protein LJC07_07690 [Christensenellaceae bacterium OttesenSCG-928-L17]|nr:hypothetical protein [Christensenellaceae bacterium OttesenSCG-928-L17]
MKKERSYIDSVHFSGRIWMVSALILLVMVPVAIGMYYNAWPKGSELFAGLMGVVPIFWTVAVIEVFTYSPMLGSAGSYLGFVTGNMTNLKVPCALNAMEGAKVKPGSEEGELISTIAIAASSIVTVLIIALGVFLLAQIQPILESPALAPAFDNILPSLFGALGVVLISKDWKVAVAPVLCMSLLFIFVPSLSSAVGVLVPVSALIAIGVARILYKKNLL